jgi:hypothetical protein
VNVPRNAADESMALESPLDDAMDVRIRSSFAVA